MTLVSFKIPHQTPFICRYGGELPDRSADHPAPDDPDRDGHNLGTPDILPARLLPGHPHDSHHCPHPLVSVEPQDQRDAASEDSQNPEGILRIQGLVCCILVGSDGVFEEDFIHDLLLRS